MLTAGEIAKICGGKLRGEAACKLDGLAPANSAGASQVAYVSDLSDKALFENSRAGCLIAPLSAENEKTSCPNVVCCENPLWAFTLVMRRVYDDTKPAIAPGVHPSAVIHPSAKIGGGASVGAFCVVEKGADIGEGSVIYPHCFIGENSRVGAGCLLYPNVVIRENCELGARVIIHSSSVIGADGFRYLRRGEKHEKIPQLGRVVIEDDVEIGALSAVDRAMLSETRVGAGTKIDNLVQIAHNVKIGRNCIVVSQAGVAGSCELGDGAVLGGQAGIADHVKIGSGAVVAAQTGVMANIPDGQVVFGSPSRPRGEAFRIEAVLSKLPEMYKFFRELRKKFPPAEK